MNSNQTADTRGETPPVAIVTGAASGIGKALATDLIVKGWCVACCDIQKEAGSAVAAGLGPNAAFFELDVTDYDAQARTFSQVWDRWGRLDALFANAGHSDRGSIYILNHRGKTELPPKPALKSIKACYESFLYGVQLAIHFMRKNNTSGGRIVATSTIASVHPHQTFPEYCGAKAAVGELFQFAAIVNELRLDRLINLYGQQHQYFKLYDISARNADNLLVAYVDFKQKENITLNAVLPGIVITGAVPQASIDATNPEHITPVETVVNAYNMCLTDSNINGQLIECSVDKNIFLPLPDFANGAATKRACTVWEPLFKAKHHEKSGLQDTIS